MGKVKPSLEVKVLSSKIIPAPIHGEPTEIPLNIFDRYAPDVHVGCMFAFSPPTTTNAVILEALVKTLTFYPTLTGQLGHNEQGRPCIFFGGRGDQGGGVLVVEAEAASTLADHLPFEPSHDKEVLHPVTEDPTPEYLFQVQLTRFACGGLVLGYTNDHRAADGTAMSNFIVSWARTARGLSTEPIAIYDSSWSKPRNPPKCEIQHWGYHFLPASRELWKYVPKLQAHKIDVDSNKIIEIKLHYTRDYITALKDQMNSDNNKRYSTFEMLAGDLWRKITIARGLIGDQPTIVFMSMNGRRRLQKPVPKDFFGNLVVEVYRTTTADQLIKGGLREAVRIIHDATRNTGNDYFQSMIDFDALHGHEELLPAYKMFGNVFSPTLYITSWLQLQLHEITFGGELCGLLPLSTPWEGAVYLIPSVNGDGGIDAVVTVLDEHVKKLKMTAHDRISYDRDCLFARL